jgi:hypothetical protein
MNDARQLYLASYGRIDTIDSLIKHCGLFYCSWKYWHACKLHVMALALVVAYNMYLEVVHEGFPSFGFESKNDAKSKCFLDFHQFRDRLSLQGLRYDPEEKKYHGDSALGVNTKKERPQLGCPLLQLLYGLLDSCTGIRAKRVKCYFPAEPGVLPPNQNISGGYGPRLFCTRA